MKQRIYIIIILLWVYIGTIQAWNNLPTNIPYNIFKTVKLPYSAHSTTTVFQDNQGMIWLGTYHGICRYDSYNTTFYLTEKSMPTKDCSIMSIVQTDNQHLMLGSLGGLFYFNITNGKTEKLPPSLNKIKSVRTMLVLKGQLWIGTNGEGLWKYNLRNEKLIQVPYYKHHYSSIYTLCPVGNTMYIGSFEGLKALNMETDQVKEIEIPSNNKFVNSLLWDKEKNALLIGTEGKLCLYSLKTSSIKGCNLLEGNVFKTMVFDQNHNLLIGTDAGLYIYNTNTNKQYSLVYNAYHQSISNNVIWNITIDKDQNVWLSTDNGITIMENPSWYTYNNIYEFTHSEYGNNFTSILEDSNHQLWLGGENGLIRLSHQDGRTIAERYHTASTIHPIPHNRIRQIYEDREHDVWIATDASIAKYNPVTQQFDYYTIMNTKGETGKWAYAIYEDKQGKLWITTYSAGLFVIDKQKLISTPCGQAYIDHTQTTEMEKIKDENFIRQILPGDNADIWLCGKELIICKNIITGKEHRIRVQNEAAAFCNHALWLSANDGKIKKYIPATRKLKTLKEVISNGSIISFVQENNNLWFSCIDGIYSINTKNDEIICRDLPQNLCLSGTFLPNSKEIIWGGDNCITTYRIKAKAMDKNVYITSVSNQANKESILLPPPSEKISLKSGEYVSFELSTLQYNPHQEIVFYYKLGDNNNWQSLKSGTNDLSFAHITSGSYKLSLCATNPALDKNAKITTYYIEVPSPWYACTTAIFIYFIVIIFIVISSIKWYKKRNQKLMEQHEKERSMELLRQKNEFFINMSHELKTPLSLIIAPLSSLIKATQQNSALKKSLSNIQKNALQLNTLIHKVLEFKNADFEEDNSMIRSHIDINSLVRNCLESFSSLALERNIQLNFNSNNEEIWMNIDTLKIQSAITNLISNAIKFVKNDIGIVSVSVHKEDQQVIIVVEDNGKGISSQDTKMIFIRFYQGNNQNKVNEGSGIGLYLVKKYVEMHDGKIELNCDKTTQFTISLPLYASNAIPVQVVNKKQEFDKQKDTIAIIDDNREIVAFIKNALEEQYNCVVAFDGKEGLEKIENTLPNLIIADQMMPIMNGFQLIKAIKRNPLTANIPIIMLTAKDDNATEMQSIKLGIDVFLTKPFDIDKITLQIARLINKKSALEKAVKIENIANPQFEHQPQKENYDEKLMEKITSIIEENIEDETFNVTTLADKTGFTQKQLYRKMKQITGTTPVAYIKSIKMKKAAFLLKDPQFSITEIMYMIGYSNMSYFIKCFSGEYGMTPKQFSEKFKHKSN